MSFAEYAAALLRGRRLVGLVTALAVLSALTWTQLVPPTYRASATVYFSVAVGESSGDLARGAGYSRAQVRSFASIVTMPIVLDRVRADLQLPLTTSELRRRVSVQSPVDTVVVRIDARWPTPTGASVVANALADQLVTQVGELSPVPDEPGADRSAGVRAVTVSPAALPSAPAAPRTRLDVAVALVIGLLAGSCLALQQDAVGAAAAGRPLTRR